MGTRRKTNFQRISPLNKRAYNVNRVIAPFSWVWNPKIRLSTNIREIMKALLAISAKDFFSNSGKFIVSSIIRLEFFLEHSAVKKSSETFHSVVSSFVYIFHNTEINVGKSWAYVTTANHLTPANTFTYQISWLPNDCVHCYCAGLYYENRAVLFFGSHSNAGRKLEKNLCFSFTI